MFDASTTRRLSLIGVAAVALLVSAFALGHGLGAGQATPTRPVAASPAPEPPSRPAPANPASATDDESTTDGEPTTDGDSTNAQLPPTGSAASPDSSRDPDLSPDARSSAGRLPLPREEDGPNGSRVTTGSREVALTFDDGPDPQYTPQVLAVLRKYQVKATFCLVGENAREYPELVKEIVADGHTLCNHSWDHDVDLGSRSRESAQADLMRTNEAIRAAVPDARIAYYRQPGGNWTNGLVALAGELGMTALHWRVDPEDWDLPGTRNIYDTVTDETPAGDIVLMHDAGGDRSETVSALRSILPNLTRRFYLDALPTEPRR